MTLAGPLTIDLAERRINRGLSMRALGRALSLGASTISNAEKGGVVTPAVAHSIAEFHGLKVSEVWPVAARCRRPSCTETAVRAGRCLAHHEQHLDHAHDAEDEQ